MRTSRSGWTLAIVSIALFMVTLDNLVVTTALPSIRADLGASLEDLEWTVNAYTLAFARPAAHRRRAGRPLRPPARVRGRPRHLHASASAAAALAPSTERADRRPRPAGRRRRGRRAAVAHAAQRGVPAERRGLAARHLVRRQRPRRRARPAGRRRGRRRHLLAVDLLAQRAGRPRRSCPLAARVLAESRGAVERASTCRASRWPSLGLLGVVFGIVRGNGAGWTSTTVLASLGAGAALLAAFVAWERRAPAPMLPMRFFRPPRVQRRPTACRCAMYFGVFGVDLPARAVLPDRAGLLAAARPGCGRCRGRECRCSSRRSPALLSDRIGARPLMSAGLALQAGALAWLAVVTEPDVAYTTLIARLRHGRRRDGARLRSRRQRGALAASARRRPARPRARRTRSARSAASSASRSWPSVFSGPGATPRRSPSSTASCRPVGRRGSACSPGRWPRCWCRGGRAPVPAPPSAPAPAPAPVRRPGR